jgi:hypothetical protein
MKKALQLLVPMVLLVAVRASAGTFFSSVTTSEGQKGAAIASFTVRGWAEGDKARVEFAESQSPVLRPGLFLITLDGGATTYLVDPKERTFSKWDLGANPGPAGAPAEAAHGDATTSFSDLKVEKLAESDGGEVAAVATRHLKYRTSYRALTKVMGLQQTTTTQVDEDLWVAPKLADSALGIWLSKAPVRTGDVEFDKLLAAQQPKYDGFPLKRVAVTTRTDKAGNKTVVKSSTAVTQLIVGEMPAGTFSMGAGYREQPLGPPQGKARPDQQAPADQTAQEDQRYPFDRMLENQPDAGQPSAASPQATPAPSQQGGQPAVFPQPGQPATQPGAQPPAQPGAQPATPDEPQPEPEQPYPFERMLDATRH